MRESLTLSLVSSLQMAQQSALNALSEGMSPAGLAASGAAFPLGKLFTTLLLSARPYNARTALDWDAMMLVIGGVVALVPSWIFLSIGRFFMGAGAGIGFVCAAVVLSEVIPYADRPNNFLMLGISFAFSTIISNIMPLLNLSHYTVVLSTCIFSVCTGLLYLSLRNKENVNLLDKETTEPLSTFQNRKSKSPIMLTNVLMMLNVTIGVPIILGYSMIIFQKFGLNHSDSCYLSIGFPICQILLMFVLHRNKQLDRKLLIVGGYAVSVFMQFFLVITSSYPFLPEQQKPSFISFWFFLLAVTTSVPCNTALCVINEQFSTSTEQLRYASRGRAVMWLFAAISTSTFLPSIQQWGFTIAFLPYAISSFILLGILVMVYPREEEE